MLLPTLVTAALSLAVGLFPGTPLSPLEWAKVDHRRELPPGDLLYLVEAGLMRLQGIFWSAQDALVRVPLRRWSARLVPIERLSRRLLQTAEEAEIGLAEFGMIGLLFLLLLVVVLVAQLFSMI